MKVTRAPGLAPRNRDDLIAEYEQQALAAAKNEAQRHAIKALAEMARKGPGRSRGNQPQSLSEWWKRHQRWRYVYHPLREKYPVWAAEVGRKQAMDRCVEEAIAAIKQREGKTLKPSTVKEEGLFAGNKRRG